MLSVHLAPLFLFPGFALLVLRSYDIDLVILSSSDSSPGKNFHVVLHPATSLLFLVAFSSPRLPPLQCFHVSHPSTFLSHISSILMLLIAPSASFRKELKHCPGSSFIDYLFGDENLAQTGTHARTHSRTHIHNI